MVPLRYHNEKRKGTKRREALRTTTTHRKKFSKNTPRVDPEYVVRVDFSSARGWVALSDFAPGRGKNVLRVERVETLGTALTREYLQKRLRVHAVSWHHRSVLLRPERFTPAGALCSDRCVSGSCLLPSRAAHGTEAPRAHCRAAEVHPGDCGPGRRPGGQGRYRARTGTLRQYC